MFEIQQKWAITYLKRSSLISFYGTEISYPWSIFHDHSITKPDLGSFCHTYLHVYISLRKYHITFSHFNTKWSIHLYIILGFSQQLLENTPCQFLIINARLLNIVYSMYHVCCEHLRTEPMSLCSWRHRSRFPTVCCWDANHGSSGHITTPCEAGDAATTGAICCNWWCAALTASIFSLWRSSSRFFICFRSLARLFWNHIFTCNSKRTPLRKFQSRQTHFVCGNTRRKRQ